jgi:hypothetical protein
VLVLHDRRFLPGEEGSAHGHWLGIQSQLAQLPRSGPELVPLMQSAELAHQPQFEVAVQVPQVA